MKYLYLDNFRGFNDTLIPIESMNFFVGENSTGKSSVLALLSLLSSPRFWFSQEFNTENHEFGDFNDIVSASSPDKSGFCIGFCHASRDQKTGEPSLRAALLTYKQREGLPDLYYYSQVSHAKIVNVILQKNTYRYRLDDFFLSSEDRQSIYEGFRRIRSMHEAQTTGFKKLDLDMPSKQAVFPLLSLVDALLQGKNADGENLSFYFPRPTPEVVWLAPIRTKPRRTYDGYGKQFSPNGEHTPYLLRKQLGKRKGAFAFARALQSFGKSSGLFREVRIRQFGRDATGPFELHVVLAKRPLRINSVGYGVSQILPVVVEMLSRKRGSWFAIQQPEVHLHPRAQASLGDLLFHLMKSEQKHFLIETHSDFTMDRFRSNFRKIKGKAPRAQVLFFEQIDGTNHVTPIPVTPSGEYSPDQPPTFREFFLREQLDLLGL